MTPPVQPSPSLLATQTAVSLATSEVQTPVSAMVAMTLSVAGSMRMTASLLGTSTDTEPAPPPTPWGRASPEPTGYVDHRERGGVDLGHHVVGLPSWLATQTKPS